MLRITCISFIVQRGGGTFFLCNLLSLRTSHASTNFHPERIDNSKAIKRKEGFERTCDGFELQNFRSGLNGSGATDHYIMMSNFIYEFWGILQV